MLSVFDRFFLCKYNRQEYNCLHFTVDVWKHLFNTDLSFLLPAVSQKSSSMNEVVNSHILRNSFKRISKPNTPSLVLLTSVSADDTHIATYIDRRIFHMSSEGVFYLPPELVRLGFTRMVYYEYCTNN